MNESHETWKPIPGFEHYEASNLGRVRLVGHYEKTRNRWGEMVRWRNNKMLSQCASYNGMYLACSIKNKHRSVHRIVAMAFHGLPQDGQEVNHKNGIKTDNRPENLEWVTHSQNEKHAYDVLGKEPWNKGKRYDTAKAVAVRKKNYEALCVSESEEYSRGGQTQAQMAQSRGISGRTMNQRIARGRKVIQGE